MRKIYALLAMFLIVCVVFTACGTKSTTGNTDSSKQDPFKKHAQTIEVKTVRVDMPFIQWANGDNMDNNVWYRTYEEELGIKVKNMWVVEPAQLKQKTDLMIASGDLADVFQVNALQYQQLLESDMIEDLSSVYKKYISNDAKTILTEGGPFALDAATYDGKLMGIPFTGNQLEGLSMYWIRTDWLTKLNLKAPKTQKDLEEIMIAFATQDPDGNKKADTFSLALNKTSYDGNISANDSIFFSYGGYPNEWIDVGGGKIGWGGVQSTAKAGLEALQRLYKAGAINKEFSVLDANKAKESIVGDKVGVIYDSYYGSGGMLQPHCDAIKNYNIWQAYALPSNDNKPVKIGHDTSTNGYHVVRKGFKNPEVAVQFLNMWIQEFYINTTDNNRYLKLVQNDKGTDPKWNLALCQAYRPLNNINNFRNLKKYVKNNDKAAFDKVTFMGKSFYNGGLRFKQNNETTQWFWWVMHCPEYENPSMEICDKAIVDKNLKPNLFYGAPTVTMTEKWNILKQKQSEAYIKMITGAIPLSDFDKFVKEWNDLGGKKITDEVNTWYEDHKNASKNEFVK